MIAIKCIFVSARKWGPKVEMSEVQAIVFKRKIRTRLDLLSIPQSGGKNFKTFRWDQRLVFPWVRGYILTVLILLNV